MLLWIGFAILTAGVIAVLARPLLKPADQVPNAGAADVEVYRDQLGAIAAEQEQGLLDEAEAAAARAELARRLIRAADAVENSPKSDISTAPTVSGSSRDRTLLYLASALIPVLSIGVYLAVGSPEMPSTPFAERITGSHKGRSITELIGLVETRLKANPDDGQGWEVIGPVYLKQRRYNDAVRAFANSIRLNGETPDRLSDFAEALVMANNGLVIPDARKAYERLLVIAPDQPEPRFWLAMAKEQDGDLKGAIAEMEAMLKAAPADAPWRSMVEGRLGEVRSKLAGGTGGAPGQSAGVQSAPSASAGASAPNPPAAGAGGGGPGPADVAAVQQMSPEQRSAFIRQMVDGLAERLAKDGKDLEGWKRLARAYKVMGREADAAKALVDARRAFDGDAAAQQAIDALAKDLGMGS